jgi:hypothetical protein
MNEQSPIISRSTLLSRNARLAKINYFIATLNGCSLYLGTDMKKDLILVLAISGLSSVIVLGSTLFTVTPIFASSDQETAEGDEPQDQSGGDESETSEPVSEPIDDTDPNVLDDRGLIEREKECPKGEYDNGGKCAKIPECTPPESWSAMEKKCRIFPWWLVMR